MWKSIVVGATALAIAGTSLVYAQQQRDDGASRWRPSQEDRAAFTDARIAALKAGLRLTPDQEKNWPAFETALRDVAQLHQQHRAGMQQSEPRSDDPTVRLRRHAEMMSNAGATLKRLADAQEPLYQSLDDSQKNRFRILARILTRHGSQFAQMQGRRHHRMMEGHHGMMREHHGMMGGHRGTMRGERHRDGDERGGSGMRSGERGQGGGMMDHMGTEEQL
jgi:zinc resistance-associated protein